MALQRVFLDIFQWYFLKYQNYPFLILCDDAQGNGVGSTMCSLINTVFCLIKMLGALAMSNLVSRSKSLGSELSNGGFGLKTSQLLRKIYHVRKHLQANVNGGQYC